MKTLKSKIITLRYLKAIFYLIFTAGTLLFLVTTASVGENIIRNGSVSVVLMIFGLGSVAVCNHYIALFLKEFKLLKEKRGRTAPKIIEFEKIA